MSGSTVVVLAAHNLQYYPRQPQSTGFIGWDRPAPNASGDKPSVRLWYASCHSKGREASAMNKMFLVLGLSVLISLPVLAALKVGEKAPDFSAQASLAGKEFKFSLADALKKGPAVLYFYPSAYTKGCDLEAHTFAE